MTNRPVNCPARRREEGRSSCPACGANVSTGLKCRHAPPADVAGLLTGAVWHFMDAKTVENFGPWVRYSDYTTLSARVANLIATIESLRDTKQCDARTCDTILGIIRNDS